jgi:guanidinopropionase
VDLKKPGSGLDIVFLGVPWEGTLTWGGYSGCELSTKTTRHASARYGAYLPEYDVDAAAHLKWGDAGDVVIDPGDPVVTMAAIRSAVRGIYERGAVPFVFGGDHSYTPEAVAALAENTKGKVGVVHLDAHLDNMDHYNEDPYARCSPLYRILHQEGVRPESVVHFGIRGPRNSPYQAGLARDLGARVMSIKEVRDKGVVPAIEEAIGLAHEGTEAVYFTICSDILDAAHNPGGPPDFGGLTSYELFEVAHRVAKAGIQGMDMVEVYPLQDKYNRSSHLTVWTFVQALVGMALAGGA